MNAVATGVARIARPELARRLAGALDSGHAVLVANAGYGKTMALEEATEQVSGRAVWVSCGESGGDAGRFLLAALGALRVAVPGLADVVGDRLVSSAEAVDVRSVGAALLAELERLLVEPLVIVFDDAEAIEHAPGAVELIEDLLNSRAGLLSVAIATRRPLPLKLARLRAAGRLVEIGPAELAFTPAECEELLALRHGRSLKPEEVEAVLAASEGWPMGVALTGLAGPADVGDESFGQEELFRYLAEEVLDDLEPGTRDALIDSSVPRMLTPKLAEAMGLPPGFIADIVGRGLFLRGNGAGTCSYHPLFRAFLLERLRDQRTEPERAELYAAAARALADSGRQVEAIELWLEAGRFEEALKAISRQARGLVRTSSATVGEWLSRLPPRLREEPAYELLEGHLLWSSGRHEEAIEPLRAAAAGFKREGDVRREWLARLFLVDAVFSVGAFDEMFEVVEGCEAGLGGRDGGTAAGVAWYQVMALTSAGRPAEAEALAQRLRADVEGAGRFGYADALSRVGLEPAAGRSRETLETLHEGIAQLERDDPYGSLPYLLSMVSLVHLDLGEREAGMQWLDRCQDEAERLGLGFVTRDCQLQRAFLLARDGQLSRAELELARAGPRRGTGWRGVHRHEAEAQVAALRGDGAEAVAGAQRALNRVRPGAICYRVWTAVNMSAVLAENGAPETARAAVDEALAALEERYPAERGRMHRATLLASRACLEYEEGGPEAACITLAECWQQAGGQADQIVRVHWPRLRPVLWRALAEGAIPPDAVVPAMQDAFPGGEALVALVNHPEPVVRRAALSAALAAGHPAVLARLDRLVKDPDPQVASAAEATRERLRSHPPPLRFELLGGFRVRRAGWELDEAEWKRPMAARVVRFLLLQGESAVPEDVLFEAFWPERDAESARQHLAQAVSRARKVLDLPGAESSMIEAKERTYRLRLRERDLVDTVEFEEAATIALADDRRGRRAALERAAALWTGEPLPEDRYSEWTFSWRERLVETYSQVLNGLVEDYESSGDYHDAIRVARRLLEVDPINERTHRHLMVAYFRTGRTSYALRQYLECRHALVVELGVEPAAETSRLQTRILAGQAV